MDASDVLRSALLKVSESSAVKKLVVSAPVSRDVVGRYVSGEQVDDAVEVAAELGSTNRLCTIDFLGEYTTERTQADTTRDTYLRLLAQLSDAGLSQAGRA